MKIRLTESELNQIVAESVKEVLSELDWKTYMNAARKSAQRGNNKRAERFEDYADDQFKEKHGAYRRVPYNSYAKADYDETQHFKPESFNHNGYRRTVDRIDATLRSGVNKENGHIEDTRIIGDNSGPVGSGTHIYSFGKDGGRRGQKLTGPQYPQTRLNRVSDEYNQKRNAMGSDMQNYYGGTAQYEKGKGWNS